MSRITARIAKPIIASVIAAVCFGTIAVPGIAAATATPAVAATTATPAGGSSTPWG
jgi:hypothetical protein